MTDGRTGATSYGFDNADRITNVTNPAPAVGQSVPVTTTYYDSLGRATNVVLPDGGSVLSSYYLTGELATNSGTRTYPVGYTYDYAGRLKTMITWTNFTAAGGAATTTWNYDGPRVQGIGVQGIGVNFKQLTNWHWGNRDQFA